MLFWRNTAKVGGMKLGIIGTGYVGLVTGACLAEIGHTVTCIDKDAQKIEKLKQGVIPIFEPELDDFVLRNHKRGRLSFSTDLASVVPNVDVLFLAVGTPPKADYSADLSAVIEASGQIGALLTKPMLVVTKSTVPVGTAEIVRSEIQKSLKGKVRFEVASNPEFLREGAAVKDFMAPDRIIVGVDSPWSETLLREVYHPFIQDNYQFLVTSIPSAEVIKYASNAFLATKISFINEIANFCEATGATIDDVAKGMGLDSRIGQKYLHAGLGYGGSCFPKDVKALIASGKVHNLPFQILEAVETVNKKQRYRIIDKLKRHLPDLRGKKIALWGLAFKAKTDDMREAPALDIIRELQEAGALVAVYDPVVKRIPENVALASDCYDCCNAADALVIVTEWEDFLYPDFAKLKQLLNNPVIIDGRNLYEEDKIREQGFVYESIGRPSPTLTVLRKTDSITVGLNSVS